MEDSTMKKLQTSCPETCDNGCEIRNVAILNYQYRPVEGSSDAELEESSVVSEPVRTCIVNNDTNPDFRIIKLACKEATEPGDVILYRVGVINTGDTTLTGVELKDTLDPETEYVNGSARIIRKNEDGTEENIGNNVTVTPDAGGDIVTITTVPADAPLEPGEIFVFSYKVEVNDPTNATFITNDVEVTVNEVEEPRLDSVDIPVNYARVSIIKVASDECVECGDCLTYTIDVTNSGTIAAINLVVTDQFDSRFCFDKDDVRVRTSTGATVPGTTINVENGLLTVTIPSLPRNTTYTITVKGEVCCCD